MKLVLVTYGELFIPMTGNTHFSQKSIKEESREYLKQDGGSLDKLLSTR